LLTRLRSAVSRVVEPVARFMASAGFSPNHVTLLSLLLTLVAFTSLYFYRNPLLYAIALFLAGLMDVVDGAMARLYGKSTKLGAFLDSTLDRVSDFLAILPLTRLNFSGEAVATLIALSMLISYARARGEALGLKFEGVGLIERAERLLLLISIAVASVFSTYAALALFYALIALSAATLAHRVIYAVVELRKS